MIDILNSVQFLKDESDDLEIRENREFYRDFAKALRKQAEVNSNNVGYKRGMAYKSARGRSSRFRPKEPVGD